MATCQGQRTWAQAVFQVTTALRTRTVVRGYVPAVELERVLLIVAETAPHPNLSLTFVIFDPFKCLEDSLKDVLHPF